jgi:hypothetical protein
MKRNLFFAIVLGALLAVPGFKVQAQLQTAPLPPPDRESTIISPPGQAPARRQTPARGLFRQNPAQGQTPARTQTPSRGQATTARQTPAGQVPAPQIPTAQQTPAATGAGATAATPATGIPNKGLFLSGLFGAGSLSNDTYYGTTEVVDTALGGGLSVGYDFGLFTGQVEFLFANDYIDGLTGMLLKVPLIAKMDFHLGRFVLQPQVGFYLNFGLGDLHDINDYDYTIDRANLDTPLLGGVIGGTLGLRMGRGYLFGDLRYMGDFGDLYTRSVVLVSLGYQYYFK